MSGRIYGFLDLETTGLDPDGDSIIEIAWAFTDEHFEVIGTPRTMLVEPRSWDSFWHALRNEPTVRAMHTESGLLADLTRSDPVDMDAVHDELRRAIRALPDHDALHLAGFSVHFDRSFLEANGLGRMLSNYFHHRLLDLSATKLLLTSLGVPFEKPVNDNPHRALSDVFESIHQARLFAAQLTGVPA